VSPDPILRIYVTDFEKIIYAKPLHTSYQLVPLANYVRGPYLSQKPKDQAHLLILFLLCRAGYDQRSVRSSSKSVVFPNGNSSLNLAYTAYAPAYVTPDYHMLLHGLCWGHDNGIRKSRIRYPYTGPAQHSLAASR